MVKLYSLAVLHRSEQGSPQLLKAAYDLSSFGFFQRGSVQEFMAFTAKILTERTAAASRQSVKQGGMVYVTFKWWLEKVNNKSFPYLITEYMCHIYVRGDGLCCVLTADHEYPQRVAHTLLTKVRPTRVTWIWLTNCNTFPCNRYLMILLHEWNHHFGQKGMLLVQLTLV